MQEDLNEAKENVRAAIGSGVNAIRDLDAKIDLIEVDGINDPTSAAEGATLATYAFDEYKEEPLKVKRFPIKLAQTEANLVDQFERGVILANYQNKCRNLMEQPANMLTPTRFGDIAKELCEPLGVKVLVHDRKWAEEKKMGKANLFSPFLFPISTECTSLTLSIRLFVTRLVPVRREGFRRTAEVR